MLFYVDKRLEIGYGYFTSGSEMFTLEKQGGPPMLNPYMGSYDEVIENSEEYYELLWYDLMDECSQRLGKKWSTFVGSMDSLIKSTAMFSSYQESAEKTRKLLNALCQHKPKKMKKLGFEFFRSVVHD